MTQDEQPASAGPGTADDLEKADLDTVYKTLGTSPKGLASAEAKARIDKYGRNELVPADVRFIDGDYISIDQAALTGESLPVSKKIGDEGYSGSIAKKGEMSAVVIGTGNNTFFGRTASLVASAGGGASHSQQATTKIGDFLIIISVVLCVILVGFELYRDIVVKHPWQWSELADIARMVLVLLIASIPVAMPTALAECSPSTSTASSRRCRIGGISLP
jgi:H+-transporting ATPase